MATLIPIVLEKQKYYLYGRPNRCSIYWKNNMGIIYMYCLDKQDFVPSGLDDEDLYQNYVLQTSNKPEEFIKIKLKQEYFDLLMSILELPVLLFNIYIYYPIKRPLRKIKNAILMPFQVIWLRFKR